MISASERKFDVIILGGGPAGLASALWCSELGLTSIILEKHTELGGQLHWIHVPIQNYPGLKAESGSDLLEKFRVSLRGRRFEVTTDVRIESVDLKEKRISLSTGERFHAQALIIATGVRRKKLDVAGEDHYVGAGILETGQIDREKLAGKTLAIVGGGDAALENAFVLSEYAEKIYLIHRRNEFSGRPEFIDRVRNKSRIKTIMNASVTMISGHNRLERIEYSDSVNGRTHSLDIDSLLIRIGVVPNTEDFRRVLELDSHGYVKVDHMGRTSTRGVYAAGDVANPISPTIIAACGMGATAAKAIAADLRQFSLKV